MSSEELAEIRERVRNYWTKSDRWSSAWMIAEPAHDDATRLLDEIERLRFSVQTNRNIGDQLADEFRRAEEAEAKRDAAQSTLDRIHALAHNIHGPLTQQRGRDFLFDVKRILNGGDD